MSYRIFIQNDRRKSILHTTHNVIVLSFFRNYKRSEGTVAEVQKAMAIDQARSVKMPCYCSVGRLYEPKRSRGLQEQKREDQLIQSLVTFHMLGQ